MTDARALLTRISAFRERLEQMPRLLPEKTSATNNTPGVSETRPTQPPVPVLDADLRDSLLEGRERIRDLRGIEDSLGTLPHPPLRRHLQRTADLLDSSLRLISHLPDAGPARDAWLHGLRASLSIADERLQLARQTAQHALLQRALQDDLCDVLWRLHRGDEANITELDPIIARLRTHRQLPIQHFPHEGSNAIEVRVRRAAGQGLHTAQILLRIGEPGEDCLRACLLQDIGLIALAEPQRPALYANHPAVGAQLIRRRFPGESPIATIIEQHHEAMDGGGFPARLQGNAIDPNARLLCLVDAYIQKAWLLDEDSRTVLTQLLLDAEAGKYDASATQSLTRLGLYPLGKIVELGDGSLAGVVSLATRPLGQPGVILLRDAEGRPGDLRFIDLERENRSIIRALPIVEQINRLPESALAWIQA
jgi:hypothetical protein